MKNSDESVEINHNPNWHFIPDHLYSISIIGGSGSGKTNVLLNLIKHQQPEIDKIYVKVEIEILRNPKAFIDYSQAIDDVYENLEDYNQTKKRGVLIVYDDMITDMVIK